MRFFLFFFPFILSCVFKSYSQDSAWHYSVEGNFIITLNTFSDNWSGTNAGSIIWVSKLNGIWKRQLTRRIQSENTLKLAFGQTRVQNKNTRKWSSPDKSSDNIDFLTILKFRLGSFIDPYTSISFSSQFLDNRLESSTAFFNPVEMIESFGIARDLIKNETVFWNFRFGCALRQNIDFNRLLPNNSDNGFLTKTHVTKDGGGELFSELRFKTANFLKFSTKVRLYQTFLSTKASETSLNDHWRYPDINLESSVNIYVTKNILFNYYINVVYDRETDPNPRIKQTMGAGLGICFTSKQKK